MEVPRSDGSGNPEPSTDPIDWSRELERVEGELDGIEQALVRLDDGTYGVCQVCAARIDDEVLAAAPATSRCRAHG
ncbi:MAG: hypothetical protein KY447_13005 [Actinobacteria bacterium]|nr:hypothetical protein [Actinomycetota bacterium]